MKIFLRWAVNTVGILFAGYLVQGIYVENITTALVAAALLGVINVLIRPVIIILTLPINILTLGLFTFVINGFLFYLIGSFIKGMAIANFGSAFLGALIISIINGLSHLLIENPARHHPMDRNR